MPYASAGVRELGFGASSAGAVPGFGEARPRVGGRGRYRSGEATRGHYVFADLSGVVVIPNVQIEEVRAVAREVEAADAAFATRSRASRFGQTKAGQVTRRRSS